MTDAPRPDGDLEWRVDVVIPPAVRSDDAALRQARLLLISTAVLTAAAVLFAVLAFEATGGMNPTTIVLSVGAVIAAANVPLLWRVGLRQCAMLICVEHVLVVSTCALSGGGIVDASLWWLMPAPLVAIVLLGSRAGVYSALATACSIAVVFICDYGGVFTYGNDSTETKVFIAAASITVLLAIAALGGASETARVRSEAKVDDALARLQTANDQLSELAGALTAARDQAVADSSRKTAFLGDMRQFSHEQTATLALVRGNTEGLARAVQSIAASVDTLAAGARDSTHSIDRVAQSASGVQHTSTTLVGAVDDVATSLSSLRAAVALVQQGYAALESRAKDTARAMGEMEASSQAVRDAAGRTADLSHHVINDAERGAQAVVRSNSGVDAIRGTAVELRRAMDELVERTDAVDRILNVIEEVAIETNVLALNASIIAAQAGVHGRGFSIVADQIKGLASRVATSTRESGEIINDVKARARHAGTVLNHAIDTVDQGQALTQEAEAALEQILRSATETTSMAQSIEARTLEQAGQASAVRQAMQAVLREVDTAVRATSDQGHAADEIAESVMRLKAIAPSLSKQADEQAKDAEVVRTVITRVSHMATELHTVQQQQTKSSQQVAASVDELHRAQQGVDRALSQL